MDAKELLSRPWKIWCCLLNVKQKVTALKSLTEKASVAFGPEAEPVSHSRNMTAMQDAIIRLSEAREEEARLNEVYMNAALEIGLVINRVQDMVMRQFLEKRYLEFMSIADAANALGHCERWGRQKHNEAVEAVQEILDTDPPEFLSMTPETA